ncbi:MAG: acyl-CoA dehydrogenase family protein [Deltaproteobacteria bacterium]|nr:acyl-CoA dehydrogenase family protein [Deltaproteobacteria bacterium]
MEFSLSQEDIDFKESVYRFGLRDLAPISQKLEYDDKEEFITENWKNMGKFGLLGLPYPEQYGGAGASVLTTTLAGEALGYAGVDAGLLLSWGAHMILCGVPIWQLGTEEQKKKYLPKLASGEWIGGLGLTEPNAGSDAGGIQTAAVKKGDRYILNGSKMFITNGPVGNVFVVAAVTDKSKKAFGISAFIVEKGMKGFSVGKKLSKLGVRTSPTSELIFEDCEVPQENILGEPDYGFANVIKLTLEWERSCLVAPAIGGLELGLKKAVEYARERKQFGKPIIKFQAIRHKIADLKMNLEAVRQIVYKVAWMKDRDIPAMMDASVAKLFVSEIMERTASEVLQIFGGYGFIKEYLVERGYRDARLSSIGGGTSEIQRGIIARSIMNFK